MENIWTSDANSGSNVALDGVIPAEAVAAVSMGISAVTSILPDHTGERTVLVTFRLFNEMLLMRE